MPKCKECLKCDYSHNVDDMKKIYTLLKKIDYPFKQNEINLYQCPICKRIEVN